MKFSPQDSSRAQVMVKEDTSRQHHCFCCFCCFFCCCCTVTMDRPHENGGVVFSIINLIWSHFSVSHLIPKINEVEIDIKESLWKSWKTKSWILGWMDMYTYVHTGSFRKNVKSKSVCTGVNFQKKWFLWCVLGWEIATNLPYRVSETTTITLRQPH